MRKARAGFTIIEVLIVLALAAVIMLIVFFAVPVLQRNSRNYQRRQDAGRIITAVNDFKAVTVTGLPGSCNNTSSSCFLRNVPLTMYDNQSLTSNNVSFWNRSGVGSFRDGSDAQLDPNGQDSLTRIQARSYTKCNGTQLTGVGATSYDVAVQFALEGGPGNNALQCVEF